MLVAIGVGASFLPVFSSTHIEPAGPLREALKALQAQGIVDVRHGYGTFVGRSGADDLLPWLAFRARSTSTLADLLDVRELIEAGLAGRLAAETADALTECVTAMRAGSSEATSVSTR